MSATAEDPASSGTVMPFVCLRSRGGAYEDSSFIAGYVCAQIDADLKAGKPVSRFVPTDVLAQVDLIAMLNDFVMTAKAWEDDPSQTLVTFKRPKGVDDDELALHGA